MIRQAAYIDEIQSYVMERFQSPVPCRQTLHILGNNDDNKVFDQTVSPVHQQQMIQVYAESFYIQRCAVIAQVSLKRAICRTTKVQWILRSERNDYPDKTMLPFWLLSRNATGKQIFKNWWMFLDEQFLSATAIVSTAMKIPDQIAPRAGIIILRTDVRRTDAFAERQ